MNRFCYIVLFLVIRSAYPDTAEVFSDLTICNKYLYGYLAKPYVIIQKIRASEDTSDLFVVSFRCNLDVCGYDTTKALFALRNQDAVGWVGIIDHFFLVDYGTGPYPRWLSIFDIDDGKKVLDTAYCLDLKKVGKDLMSIWLESADTDFSRCERQKEWEESGFGIAIEEEHYLDLKTLKLYKTAHWRCASRQ